jgi:hypothetical protein
MLLTGLGDPGAESMLLTGLGDPGVESMQGFELVELGRGKAQECFFGDASLGLPWVLFVGLSEG